MSPQVNKIHYFEFIFPTENFEINYSSLRLYVKTQNYSHIFTTKKSTKYVIISIKFGKMCFFTISSLNWIMVLKNELFFPKK